MKHTSYKISSGIMGKFCSLPFDLVLFWFFIHGGESIVGVALTTGSSRLSDNDSPALVTRALFGDVPWGCTHWVQGSSSTSVGGVVLLSVGVLECIGK
jgi:hypothetical protein